MSARSALRWLLVVAAVAGVVVATTQPLYAHVTSTDLTAVESLGNGKILKDYFVTDGPAPIEHRRSSALIKIAMLLAAAAALAGPVRRRRTRVTLAGAAAALAIGCGVAVYVLLASSALWWDGLSWLCGACVALVLVAVITPAAVADS